MTNLREDIPYDLIGKKIGKLTVLSVAGKDKRNRYLYFCKCDCGNHIQKVRSSLLQEKGISCGCIKEEKAMTDIIGKTYRCITVKSFDHREDSKAPNGKTQNKYFFNVTCKEGNNYTLEKSKIVEGKFKCCKYDPKIKQKKSIFPISISADFTSITVHTDEGSKYISLNKDPRDIIGKQFGHLIPIEIVGAKYRTFDFDFDFIYNCKCDCGNTCLRSRHDLMFSENPMCETHKKFDINSIDILGTMVNGLEVIGLDHKDINTGIYYYRARCKSCQTDYIVSRSDILNSTVNHCKCHDNNLRKVIRFI